VIEGQSSMERHMYVEKSKTDKQLANIARK